MILLGGLKDDKSTNYAKLFGLLNELIQRTEFDLQFMDMFVIAVHFDNGPGDQIAAQNNQSKVENTKGDNQVQHVEYIVIF